MRVTLRKMGGALAPAFQSDADELAKFKQGDTLNADIRRMRNAKFHRKWFALATFLFDVWSETCETQEYKGQPVLPSFERFRKDLTIMAGYYEPTFNVRGEVRLEATSLAWGSMSEETFEALYSATIDVALRTIIPRAGYDEKTLRTIVEEVLQFS